MKKQYTITAAAALTGYSKTTIRRAIDEGHIEVIQPKGVNRKHIEHAELEKWLGRSIPLAEETTKENT